MEVCINCGGFKGPEDEAEEGEEFCTCDEPEFETFDDSEFRDDPDDPDSDFSYPHREDAG